MPEQLCRSAWPSPGVAPFVDRQACTPRQAPHRFRKRDPLRPLDETNHVAAGAAPEAMKQACGAAHRKRRRPLGMEGTVPKVGAAPALERDALFPHDLTEIVGRLHLGNRVARDQHRIRASIAVRPRTLSRGNYDAKFMCNTHGRVKPPSTLRARSSDACPGPASPP